jgi:hypothetical protein
LDLSRSCLILLYNTRRASQKEGGSCWYASAGCRPCDSLLLLLLLLLALTLPGVLQVVAQEGRECTGLNVVLRRAAEAGPVLL